MCVQCGEGLASISNMVNISSMTWRPAAKDFQRILIWAQFIGVGSKASDVMPTLCFLKKKKKATKKSLVDPTQTAVSSVLS